MPCTTISVQTVVPLDLDFRPEAAISGPLLLQHDDLLLLGFNAVDVRVLPHQHLGRAVIEKE